MVNGGINYQSEYHLYAIDAAISSCLDTDNDLVPNIKDLDDDNDGLLDFTEKCYLNSADFSWHGAAQANILSPSSSVLQVTGNAWSNAYSDQTFSIPFSIEGEISGATNGMIGVLPSASAETSSWNDGGFKFQLNSNNGFLVRHGNSTNGWHGPSANGSTFRLEVDASGTMNYWYNGTIVYSNTIPDVEYKITISRGRFIIKDFALQKTSTNCNDIDLDGTPNYLDIDSDGDGCYDSVESGIQFEDIKTDGSISGNVDSQGIPLLANGGLENNMYVYDGSETAINCCDDNIPTEDCDLDGYTNQEELNGICGFIGDPLDINSPFAWQSTTASGTTDDNIFILESQSTPGSMKVGRTAHLTIKDGHELTLNSDISIRDLILEDGALLDLNGFTAVVSGNLVLDGTIIHNLGHIHMRDDCEARTISGNKLHDLHDVTIQNVFGVTLKTDLNISGVINPLEGDFDLNNQALTLTSELLGSSVQTGSIGEIQTGADISGEITIQRYVQSSEDGFRLIGSPIQNLTIADLHDDIITTGFTGSDYPSHWYTNVSYYDETNRPGGTMEEGFQKVTNTTNSITDYHGVWAYFAPSNTSATLDSQGEFNKGEKTVDFKYRLLSK